MKPVAIFRHSPTEGPGYFATFLEAHSIPFTVIEIDIGEPVPTDPTAFSGLCFMGGPMSVNDGMTWIDEVCALIRRAVEQGIPVIGHCLGGQLMSKALGGNVTGNPVKEIGWGSASVEDNEIARRWLGELPSSATVFQWHGETFSLPSGATRIVTGDVCANQMFVLGPHLAMQCHVEMTPAIIETWCGSWESEVAGLPALPASVQTPEQMLTDTADNLGSMRQLADRLYTVWIGGLSR